MLKESLPWVTRAGLVIGFAAVGMGIFWALGAPKVVIVQGTFALLLTGAFMQWLRARSGSR